ncbi:argininosuccinate lyase [Cryptosporangium arvum]|uniref:argininosuccinate lyase n=1 Tax=Cryptosporangium arvum TaxID=80871 RepID=UPI0004B70B2D|nr:argininosuccinate lyase [Cryptosporangium arvum]
MTARLTDGRLSVGPSALLVRHVNAVELDDELAHADSFVQIDLAHALMLTRQRIFGAGQGRTVVRALLELLDGDAAAALGNDPEIGTITLHLERYLERACGPDGLDIQRARSRIDQNATGLRMADRGGTLAVLRALIDLGATLLEAAATHDDVLSPGYTHLQHAQPTTLGHYFNAHYWSVSRNVDRLVEAYRRLNQCPLGGAAHSGTSWPIDRDLTAAYLGFDRPVPNARDAGLSATDVGAELAGVLGLTLAGLSRCASDLYFWSSSEVAMVRVHASLCGTSSMMPQKRNPIALERIRALAGDAAGWGASQLGLLHFATSTDADQGYVHNRLPGYCADTVGATALLGAAIVTLEVDRDRLRDSAGAHWSTASALADDLVRTRGVSYREAHDVVARLVAADASGTGLLDPGAFVESRTSAGGTASARRAELAARAADDLTRLRRTVDTLTNRVSQARARLVDEARTLAEG